MNFAALMLAATLAAGENSPNYASMKLVENGATTKLELPLKQTRLRARVTDADAASDLTQAYLNDTGKKIEVQYQFPLPENGAVTDLVVKINERVILGSIKEKAQAKKEFEEAKQAGKTAALVEQERPNFFTQNIANIQPGDQVSITLRIHHPLRYSAGSFEYAFPITLGPRYMPGVPLGKEGEGWSPDTDAVPDASRISPRYVPSGAVTSHFLDVELELQTGISVSEVLSTSHLIHTKLLPNGGRLVSLADSDKIPNKDFILRYSTASDKPQFSLQAHRLEGEEGFFSLTLVPPKARAEGRVIPKELVFVVDRSGSMSGEPMAKAKQALASCLKKLSPQDSFNVIMFDNMVERLYPSPRPAGAENIRQALAYAAGIDARGGTEMYEPLKEALEYGVDAGRQRIVFFITDGNVGNEQQLVAMVRQKLGSSRIFSVGIGSGVNRYLVGETAREGRGLAEYIRQDEDVSLRLNSMFQKISHPILTNVKLNFNGLKASELYPEKVRDLFFEEPTTILGRYQGEGSASLDIRADSAEGEVRFSIPAAFPAQSKSNPALRYAWARKKIESLSLTALGQETPELVKQITQLSIRYSVLSKYTAFIAVEREVRGDVKELAERWLIPSELPEGLRFAGFGPEIQMKVDRVRPGDPVVFVRAPKDARSVIAKMPYGELLNLEYDEEVGRHSARFLVPYGTKDGIYPFHVLITDSQGNTKSLKTRYVVDSLGPDLSYFARIEKGRLVLEAVPERNVFVDGDAEVWPDVKEVVVLLPDGTELALKLQPSLNSRFLWRWEGALQGLKPGTKLVCKAVDYAGNWRTSHVEIK